MGYKRTRIAMKTETLTIFTLNETYNSSHLCWLTNHFPFFPVHISRVKSWAGIIHQNCRSHLNKLRRYEAFRRTEFLSRSFILLNFKSVLAGLQNVCNLLSDIARNRSVLPEKWFKVLKLGMDPIHRPYLNVQSITRSGNPTDSCLHTITYTNHANFGILLCVTQKKPLFSLPKTGSSPITTMFFSNNSKSIPNRSFHSLSLSFSPTGESPFFLSLT